VTFEVREEAVGVGQSDSIAMYGIGESIGRFGEVLEDDYGIAVKPERFADIVPGVDASKFAGGSGRIGEERRGLGPGQGGKAGVGGLGGNDTIEVRFFVFAAQITTSNPTLVLYFNNERMIKGSSSRILTSKHWRPQTCLRAMESFADEAEGHRLR
jgi:hypothetical protein